MQTARTGTGHVDGALAESLAPVIVLAERRAEIIASSPVPVLRVEPHTPLFVRKLCRAALLATALVAGAALWGAVAMAALAHLRVALPAAFLLAAAAVWSLTPQRPDAEIVLLRSRR